MMQQSTWKVKVERALDISFSKFEGPIVVSDNAASSLKYYGFKLTKLIAKGVYTIFLFLCETTDDYEHWAKSLERYVLQITPILEQYEFKDKLGQGTFGYVFLAEEKENPS